MEVMGRSSKSVGGVLHIENPVFIPGKFLGSQPRVREFITQKTPVLGRRIGSSQSATIPPLDLVATFI